MADDFQITTDEQRLQQVLINFLTNAEKHTEKVEIHLHCSLTEYPDRITCSVSDTGPGIAEEEQSSVFSRFYRSPSVRDREGVGPVSYTHLDVYKRQGPTRTCMPQSIRLL